MNQLKIHVGLRTVKTALAVMLAVTFAELRGSVLPIFAAIGAIVAMSRTLSDAMTACLTQLAGITCGCVIGGLFHLFLPAESPLVIGAGIVLVISLTVLLRLEFAAPLSCIVFVSICLYSSGSPLAYALGRFMDTSIGLLTALAINVFIKPYNNRARIAKTMTHFVQTLPDFVRERVLYGHYPDISPLRRNLDRLEEEITLYERQIFFKKKLRRQVAAYLRGCQQLAERVYDELGTLCMMDSPGQPSAAQVARLSEIGIVPLKTAPCMLPGNEKENTVLAYHLDNLLNAFAYLSDMRDAPDADINEEW